MVPTITLVEAFEGLDPLATMPMPMAAAFKIMKLVKWAQPTRAGSYAERNDILTMYGKSAGEGRFNIEGPNVQEYHVAMTSLNMEPTAAPPADLMLQLKDLEALTVTPNQLMKLQALIKE